MGAALQAHLSITSTNMQKEEVGMLLEETYHT